MTTTLASTVGQMSPLVSWAIVLVLGALVTTALLAWVRASNRRYRRSFVHDRTFYKAHRSVDRSTEDPRAPRSLD